MHEVMLRILRKGAIHEDCYLLVEGDRWEPNNLTMEEPSIMVSMRGERTYIPRRNVELLVVEPRNREEKENEITSHPFFAGSPNLGQSGDDCKFCDRPRYHHRYRERCNGACVSPGLGDDCPEHGPYDGSGHPTGALLRHPGAVVPEGWAWCDGKNDRPDLPGCIIKVDPSVEEERLDDEDSGSGGEEHEGDPPLCPSCGCHLVDHTGEGPGGPFCRYDRGAAHACEGWARGAELAMLAKKRYAERIDGMTVLSKDEMEVLRDIVVDQEGMARMILDQCERMRDILGMDKQARP